jgi:hypothetical protein
VASPHATIRTLPGDDRSAERPYAQAMTARPSCGADNPEGARFCLECGNQLAALPAEVRPPGLLIMVALGELRLSVRQGWASHVWSMGSSKDLAHT